MVGRSQEESGFTLLEVLVATTIFGLVTAAAFTVFHAALRTQQSGLREVEMIQRARFIMDSLERDLTNIFFRDETSYNVAITRLLEQMERMRLEAEETGNWDSFHSTYGKPGEEDSRGRDSNEPKPSIGNPYEKGRLIDIQMTGEDLGETDGLTFAMRVPLRVGERYFPWGLARVQYSVDGGILVRSLTTIEAERRTLDGEPIPPPDPPLHTIVAEGVTKFDFAYAFWYDNQWYETNAWASANRQVRNSRYYLANHDFGFEGEQDEFSLRPGDPGWNEYLNDLDSEPLDRLPAYIRLTLELKDPSGRGRTVSYSRVLRLHAAVETWAPAADLTEEQREQERDSRDETYNLILPGVSAVD